MRDDFHKFPSTPHLATLGENPVRDDKVLTRAERDEFLRHELVIEEKVDGANLGISFDDAGNVRVQNRGAFLQYPYTGQWKKLSVWLEPKVDALFDELSDGYVLFGEWCYAKHSILYDRLSDWFLGFDVLDLRPCRFMSTTRRDAVLARLGLASVPVMTRGRFSLADLKGLLAQSQLRDGPPEGLYARRETGDWLEQRAKLVRAEFTQSIGQHWADAHLVTNILKMPNQT